MYRRPLRGRARLLAAVAVVAMAALPGRADESSPLCTNLSGLTDWSGEWPFVDAFKTSRSWISGQRFGCWDCAGALDLDEHGWVRSLNTAVPSGGQVARTLMFVGQGGRYPAGTYTVLYDGQGTLEYSAGARKDAAASGPGRDVVIATPANGDFLMTLVATTPGNHLRHIRVLMPGGACENDPLTACSADAACGASRCLPFTQTYPTQIFHPNFLRNVSRYRAIRFMDWMGTNDSPVQEAADYPRLEDARWPEAPPEIMAELGNRVDADVWVTIPAKASDAFVRDFAERLRVRLHPERKVYVEYSNEVWNTIFSQHGETARRGCGRYPDLVSACDQDQTPGNGRLCEGHPWPRWVESCATASRRYFSDRSVAVGALFAEVFGGTARVVRVMASQTGNTWLHGELLSWRNNWQQVDTLATAPYVGGGYGTRSEVASWTLDRLMGDIQGTALPQSTGAMRADARLLTDRYPSLWLSGYEGGQHLVGVNGLENNAAMNALFDGANSDARMGGIYTSYLGGWKAAGGRTFCHFVNTSQWSKWGRWGALRYQDQPAGTSPKFTALMSFIDNNRCWWPGCEGGGGGNVAPVARPGGSYRGEKSAPVSFDGRASSDADGSIAGYVWDFGDGASGSGPTPQHVYASAGVFTVRLTVTDDDGASGSATTSATIADVPSLPDVVVSELSYASGSFTSRVTNQGGAATPAAVDIGVAYFVDNVYRTWGSVRGPLAAGASVVIGSQGGAYTIPPGTHTIRAWVDDINRFPESNETNNQLSRVITIGPSDTTPPVISNPLPSGTLAAGTTSTTMRVTTSEAATCRWGTAPGTPYASLPNTFTTTGGTSHATLLTGLADGQSYLRYVRCLDGAGNANTSSTAVSFGIASPSADILWRDNIQAGGPPFGFSQLAIEHPIGTSVPPSDSSGANLSRVPNPLPGGGFAMRHFATFDNGGSRSQAGIYSFANAAFNNQAKSPEGVWVAQEWYFPSAITAQGDQTPWMNLWDWHSTSSGGNRWHTAPGLMLAEDGSMRVKWEWGGPAGSLNPGSPLSSIALPVGRWFDVEMHYRWTAGRTTLSLWIDGVLALQQSGVQTRAASHNTVETYVKFYGSRNGGTPWSPTPSVKYTRNVRVAGHRIWR